MITKEKLERGIRATEARLAEARKDPLVIREIEEARAEQTGRLLFLPCRAKEEGRKK